MQAIVIHEWGDPSVLRNEQAPDPVPGPGEALVELRAAALNRPDIGVRKGAHADALPLIPGSDGSGVRRDTGEETLERARALGADAGVLYTRGDWAEEVRELTGGTGVDLVIDSVAVTWPDSLRCLRPGGRLVTFGATGGPSVEVNPRRVYFGHVSILGTTMGSPRDFERLLALVRQDAWRPQIDSVRPLAEAENAHARMEAGAHFGKLVLEIA